MPSQLRFTTVQSARDVVREIYLGKDVQAVRGNAFTLTLLVKSAVQKEDKTIDIYVDRLDDTDDSVHTTLPDGTRISNTKARITPDGEPFEVAVVVDVNEFARGAVSGATVRASKEMPRIIREHLSQLYNQEMDDFLESLQ